MDASCYSWMQKISVRHMAVAITNSGLLLVVFCLLMITDCRSSHGLVNEQQLALFVFGDSLYDPGNNNFINTISDFQANFWPYGESYFNPPTGRFSNGRLISDFIAEFANLPLIPTYLDPRNNDFLHGANFESAGAGALVETSAGFVVDLKTQLQNFRKLIKTFRKNLGDSETKQILSNAVYLISCGGNDYFSSIGNNYSILYSYSHEQYVGMVIGNLTESFKGIYEKGGRKIGIVTVPPIGCYPSVRAGRLGNTCNEEIDVIVNLHNQKLSQKLEELENQLEGFMLAKYDVNTAIRKRMKHPTKYGFKVGDSACCGSGPFGGIFSCGGKRGVKDFDLCDNVDDYLFFDSNHINEVAYRQLAEMFWNGDSNKTSPFNLKALFQGKKSPTPNILDPIISFESPSV